MRNRARDVPQDVLLIIFDDLSLTELLIASLASRHWRRAARAHPTFWRCITLSKAAPAAVDLFMERVSSSQTALVSLDVHPPLLAQKQIKVVIDAIAANIGRCFALKISLDSFPLRSLQQLMRALSNPVPHLDSFAISSTESTVLRRNLFGSVAPVLTTLSLHNISFAPKSVPTSLAAITSLTLRGNPCQQLPLSDIVSHLLHLEELVLLDTTIPYQGLEGVVLASLLTLHVDRYYSSFGDFEAPRLHTISISRLACDQNSNNDLFSWLEGPLHLEIQDWCEAHQHGCTALRGTGPGGIERAIVLTKASGHFRNPRTWPSGTLSMRVASASIPLGALRALGEWFDGRAPELLRLELRFEPDTSLPLYGYWFCEKLESLTVVGGGTGYDAISHLDMDYLRYHVLDIHMGPKYRGMSMADVSKELELVLKGVNIDAGVQGTRLTPASFLLMLVVMAEELEI